VIPHFSGKVRRSRELGVALPISILVLFILSALGLYLLLTTRIEADIAVNQRWTEMAFFNAEAGLEYAKNVLAGEAFASGDLRRVLPPARTPSEMSGRPADPLACPDATRPGCRDYQYQIAEGKTTIVIGKVLPRPDGSRVQFDFRQPDAGGNPGDIDGDRIPDVQGTVTVWLRRPVLGGVDERRDDRAVLTSEGTAPNFESAATGRPGALKRLEMTVRVVAGVEGLENALATNSSGTGPNASSGVPAGQLLGSVR